MALLTLKQIATINIYTRKGYQNVYKIYKMK